jgi:hypothetical protein
LPPGLAAVAGLGIATGEMGPDAGRSAATAIEPPILFFRSETLSVLGDDASPG